MYKTTHTNLLRKHSRNSCKYPPTVSLLQTGLTKGNGALRSCFNVYWIGANKLTNENNLGKFHTPTEVGIFLIMKITDHFVISSDTCGGVVNFIYKLFCYIFENY